MKHALLALSLVILWPSLALARPILVAWKPYIQGATPAHHLTLTRSVNGGAFTVLTTLGTAQVSYLDSATRKKRRYCYDLRAETTTGQQSTAMAPACAQAR